MKCKNHVDRIKIFFLLLIVYLHSVYEIVMHLVIYHFHVHLIHLRKIYFVLNRE